MSSRPVGRLLAAMLALAVPLLVNAVPVSAAPAIRVTIDVGSFCVEGTGPAETRHVVTLRAPDGTFRARSARRSDEDGDFYACFYGGSLFTLINPRDVVHVRAGELHRRIVVPDLLPRIDRRADVVRGRLAARGRLKVAIDPIIGKDRSWSVPIGDDGRWRLDTSEELDLIGGDGVLVSWRVSGDTFRTTGAVPFLEFSPQGNIVLGAARPGGQVTVTVNRDGDSVASAAALRFIGVFQALLEDARGHAVYPRTGDVVSAGIAGGVALRVPRWGLTAVGMEDTITGRCMADVPYTVTIARDFSNPSVERGTTDHAGRFTRRSDALRRGDTVTLTCTYPGGDRMVVETIAD